MKEILLPKARHVGDEQLNAGDVLDRVVFSQPLWRERARVAHGLSLIPKTRAGASSLQVTDAELESLEKGLELPGLQVTPPALNHFFLEVVAAIYAAKPVAEEKPK